MAKNKSSVSKGSTLKGTKSKTVNKNTELERNEVILKCSDKEFQELVKKCGGKISYENFGRKVNLIEVLTCPI